MCVRRHRVMVGGACKVPGPAHDLKAVELVVHSLLLEQFGVGSLLDDLSAAYHGNGVRVVDGGETVSDDNARPSLPCLVQGLLDYLLALSVQGRGGLVQEQDPGVSDESTGNGDSLLLSPRQLGSLAAHVSIVALSERW